MQGLFFLRSIGLLVLIILDERLRIDDRRPVVEEMEFCRESVEDFFSDLSNVIAPPVRSESKD